LPVVTGAKITEDRRSPDIRHSSPAALTYPMRHVDLEFLGSPGIIATAVLSGDGGVTLIDPGPASCLPALERGLQHLGFTLADVRTILLTHIHLDHAGASGSLVRRDPRVQVFVHERGAPHMIDPSTLMASAARLYGADMDRLWGEMVPIPAPNVHVLRGGERLEAGGRRIEVMYTPGHAWHHVSYLDLDEGVAYVGDTAGIRRTDICLVVPPTPPPDIDLDAWRDSLSRILSRRPEALFITHFGEWRPAAEHAHDLLERLGAWSVRVRDSLAGPGSDAEKAAAFADEVRTEIRARLGDEGARAHERAARFDFSWQGLARYWRKKGT
jgi:glyoxylase-like metal-dependent hydrolase (beta-lactamase superfamily II)